MQLLTPQRDGPPYYWAQGEHIAVSGDTGSGKSYLTRELDYLREYVVRYKTKSDNIKMPGFRKARTADLLTDQTQSRILLQPPYEWLAREGWRMFDLSYRQGGWTIDVDELWLAHKLGLQEVIERHLTQGRSLYLSMVIGMQRPVAITRFALSQATHLFAFRLDGRDIKTFAEATTPRVIPLFDTLAKYEFVYYNRATRYVGTGNAKELGKIFTNPPVRRPTLDTPSPAASDRAREHLPAWVRKLMELPA